MNVYYHPLDTACKSVVGGVSVGTRLDFNLFHLKEGIIARKNGCFITPNECDCRAADCDASLFFARDGEQAVEIPMRRTDYGWTLRLKLNERGLYFYYFRVGNIFLGLGEERFAKSYEHNPTAFQLLVYARNYRTPNWFKGGIMYQIFPDRFCRIGTMPDINDRIQREDWGGLPSFRPNEKGKVLNNDYFGGNLKGIQSKLSYLKSLNVSCIYLNPVFEANSNHRYDTADYLKIDPFLGDSAAFRELVDTAKQHGIRIVLDGVFNHTGDNSVYFNKYGKYPSVGAYQSTDSPYYSWYNFERFPDKYASWWGIDVLPEINENSESYQDFIFGENGVLKTWLSYGIGGYRLDVADELPDFFLKKLRSAVKSANSEAVIIGEVWEDASNKIAYSVRREYFQGDELDSVMNYPLKDAIIRYILTKNATALSDTVKMLCDHYPKQTLDSLMNILGTHDTARILTVFGQKNCYSKEEMANPEMRLNKSEKQTAREMLKMASLLQYTLPGVPCVYYGDENGTEGYSDPFCRGCFDWEHTDELSAHYKKLGEIRKNNEHIFKDGRLEELFVFEGCYLFKRIKSAEEIFVFTNNSARDFSIILENGNYTELFNGSEFQNSFTIKPYSYGIIKNSS